MIGAGLPKARVVGDEVDTMEGEKGSYLIQDFADLERTFALTQVRWRVIPLQRIGQKAHILSESGVQVGFDGSSAQGVPSLQSRCSLGCVPIWRFNWGKSPLPTSFSLFEGFDSLCL